MTPTKESNLSQSHAIIIEDDTRNRQVLGKLLAHEGLTHTDVPDPNQMANALENVSQVDVVFLDLEMPGMNGYDVLKVLQSDSSFENVPIVACTVHVNEMNNAYELGFHSFLAKPLDPDRFPSQLARILNGERVWERA